MKSSKDEARLVELMELHRSRQLAQSLIISGDIEALDEIQTRLTRTILCEDDGREDCPCRSCHTPVDGHPDAVQLIPSPRTIGRDAVQSAVAGLSAGPLWSPAKVVAIRPADSLGREAESYLLKHLEEPPDFVYYLLLTEAPDAIIATIRSRCSHWRFSQHAVRADSPEDTVKRLWSEPLTADRVVQAAYWARRQYIETGRAAWLEAWEALESSYRQLEANGNAELTAAQVRRAWPR